MPPDVPSEAAIKRRRRVVAKCPGQTWHVDLTTVPTQAGFWVPWSPFSLPQHWSFCWRIGVAIDQASRSFVGFAIFSQRPSSKQVQRFLDRAIRSFGKTPRYVITDKGRRFWCRVPSPRGQRARIGVMSS